jgi:late competence protein required for DNA uptake (superfamily II DNA/RNA helicase)
VAPCGRTIRNCTGRHPGDSWSASLRFIQCKKCRQLGKRGRFELVAIPTYLFRVQTKIRWREQLGLRGVA